MTNSSEAIKELIDIRINEAEKEYGTKAKLLIIELLALQRALQDKEHTRYIGVSEWNKYYSYPTVSGLRNMVNKSANNGFDKYNVVHRQNGHVFINEQNYFKWFKEYKA